MRKMKFTLNRQVLNQIYISYDLLQNKATRIQTGLTRSASLERLYLEYGWHSLQKRRDL